MKTPVSGLERSLTQRELMFAEHISPSTYFKLKRLGFGPEETIFPGTNIIRITPDARRAWHAKLAMLRATVEASKEAQRRTAYAVQAGKAAARSELHVSKRGKVTRPRGGR
jgi:hypothetical protein